MIIFNSLLKQATFFEAVGAVAKIGLSLNANHHNPSVVFWHLVPAVALNVIECFFVIDVTDNFISASVVVAFLHHFNRFYFKVTVGQSYQQPLWLQVQMFVLFSLLLKLRRECRQLFAVVDIFSDICFCLFIKYVAQFKHHQLTSTLKKLLRTKMTCDKNYF